MIAQSVSIEDISNIIEYINRNNAATLIGSLFTTEMMNNSFTLFYLNSKINQEIINEYLIYNHETEYMKTIISLLKDYDSFSIDDINKYLDKLASINKYTVELTDKSLIRKVIGEPIRSQLKYLSLGDEDLIEKYYKYKYKYLELKINKKNSI
jgi:hypothetical protein